MIPIRFVGKDKKLVGTVDETTPVPHSLARVNDKSENYGLTTQARLEYPELVKKKDEGEGASVALSMDNLAKEVEDIRERQTEAFKREMEGRAKKEIEVEGAAGGWQIEKKKETDEEIIMNIGNYVESDELDKEETVDVTNPPPILKSYAAALATPATSSYRVAAVKNVRNTKTNGYCLFIKHIAKQRGATGSIKELMKEFDRDWKMLPDEKKAEWKIRAKSGTGSDDGSGSSQVKVPEARVRH